jgi:predicted transcriptional regulator/ribosome-associated translation inhibitor RaiA
MEIKKTAILESSEPLSKALAQLDTAPAVLVTKDGKYFGMIDHRSVSPGMRDPKNTKCEGAVVKPPVMNESVSLSDCINAFLLGHFKALPIIAEDGTPIGITTRVESLKLMHSEKMVPAGKVSELMNSPVYLISEDESVASLKTALKEKNAHRMVVIRKSKPIGVVSTFDIGAWIGKSNLGGGRKDVRMSEKLDLDNMPIRSFLRPDVTTVEEAHSLDDAVKRMIDKQVSSVIITSGKKAVGVLSALDIFKEIQKMGKEKTEIQISGLSEDNITHYDHIRDKMSHVLDKFKSSFNIRRPTVHVKQNKSTFTVSLSFDTDHGPVSMKGERADLKETVDELADELDRVLRKRKDQKKPKSRATSYGGKSGTGYL